MNVPVLARTLEALGLSTILVTMMPYWAEQVGVPRTLAVEFPFGHTLGQPNNKPQQLRVIFEALKLLDTANTPGAIGHSSEEWPVPQREAYKSWQPKEMSPIIKEMAPRFRQMLREHRQR